MWFVVQLEEYYARSGNDKLLEDLKPRVFALLDYFKPFENSDGLLESLESWVFVEWSAANNFVQDVNYPSNMLYSGVLSAVGRLYDQPELVEKAEKIRDVIRQQAYDGLYFVDNALRKETGLEVTKNRTEVCQYFAFFFDIASPERNPDLWQQLADEFGPDRVEKKLYPEIHPANSFIGNMLRFELLSRYGRGAQIMEESVGYLSYMAERTGTLWENTGAYASCNHGFASHIVHTLYRDGLGLATVDKVNRRVVVKRVENGLEWCKGEVPTMDGPVRAWTERDENGNLQQQVRVPSGWTVEWLQ
jgi:alpha-L-rhamnosidase